MNEIEKDTIKLYLLGQMGQEQQTQFEERLLTDKALYGELLISEDELLDQYLANELTTEEGTRFETHFLITPERQQKLRFARSFRSYVKNASAASQQDELPLTQVVPHVGDPTAKPKDSFFAFFPFQNPVLAYAISVTILVSVAGISWIVFHHYRTPSREPGSVFLVTLTPRLTRGGGETTTIRLPLGAGTLQLRLELRSDDYQSYRADVTRDDENVLTTEGLKLESVDNRRVLHLPVPAGLLSPQDYRVKLSGRRFDGSHEDIDTYVFRVVK